jgi:transcriptional regulator with PAS, ATPase and Fis domain
VRRTDHVVVVDGGWLDVLDGSGTCRPVGPQPLFVGRGAHCGLSLAGDLEVSALHLRVHVTADGRTVLRDLGSTNGTLVDAVRVRAGHEVELTMQHEIVVGDTRLRFRPGGHSEVALSEGARFGQLVGSSTVMRALFAQLERVADTNASVLILGETGCGKDRVAQSIHESSSRRHRRPVTLNCGALPESLLAGQLFGHVRGSFTGAERDHSGYLFDADGSTLFLDELGEMSLDAQRMLLRVIQNKEAAPLGSKDPPSPIDVRYICATNADIHDRINRGTFREDLFYRIADEIVEVPPVRARPDDLPLLVSDILEDEAPGLTLDEHAHRRLVAHSWPGNVRELRSVLLRAVRQCTGKQVLAQHISIPSPPPRSEPAGAQLDGNFEALVETMKREYILSMARKHQGNVTHIAGESGMSLPTVRKYLQQYAPPASAHATARDPGLASPGWLRRVAPGRRSPS